MKSYYYKLKLDNEENFTSVEYNNLSECLQNLSFTCKNNTWVKGHIWDLIIFENSNGYSHILTYINRFAWCK